MLELILVSFIMGTLLITGAGFSVGTIADPMTIEIPHWPVMGGIMYGLCAMMMMPPWVLARISRTVRRFFGKRKTTQQNTGKS